MPKRLTCNELMPLNLPGAAATHGRTSLTVTSVLLSRQDPWSLTVCISANGTAVVAKNKFRLSTARLFQLQNPPETNGAINTVYNNAHLSIK